MAAPASAPAAAQSYAVALGKGTVEEVATLTSARARAASTPPSRPSPSRDTVEAAAAIDDAAVRCASSACGREIRAEVPGSRPIRLVADAEGWKLAALPFGGGSASVDEAVSAFLQAIDQRDPDALMLLVADRHPGIALEIAERAEALRSKRGATEVSGARARLRVGDSWWLIVASTKAGWKVVGVEP